MNSWICDSFVEVGRWNKSQAQSLQKQGACTNCPHDRFPLNSDDAKRHPHLHTAPMEIVPALRDKAREHQVIVILC
jgi:hypothetical protein